MTVAFRCIMASCLLYLSSANAVGQVLHSSVNPLLNTKWGTGDSIHSSVDQSSWTHSIDTLYNKNSSAAASLKEPVIPGAEEHQKAKEQASRQTGAVAKGQMYETGKATYYSSKMHGRKMADGTVYDKNALYCAHKKLPFGTKVRVVNQKNGKEVTVVVHDRGPFGKGMIIDLSNKAAQALDMISAGVVPVELYIE